MTDLLRNILLWVLHHLLALVLILLILIAGRYVLPPAVSWARSEIEAARGIPAQRSAHAKARSRFDAWSTRRRTEAEAAVADLGRAPVTALRERRAAIGPDIAARQRERLDGSQLALAAAQGHSDPIFAHYRAGAEIALLDRERRYIDALLEAHAAQAGSQDMQARRRQAVDRLGSSYSRWRAASDQAQALSRRPLAGPRNFLCRTATPAVGCNNYRALVAARAERDAALADNRNARGTIEAIDRIARGLSSTQAAAGDASASFNAQRQALAARSAELDRAARGNWYLWIRKPIVEMLPTALLILFGVIFAPLLLKALLYFVVAPLAARRPPVRLVNEDEGDLSLEGASAVSQRVALEPGSELLLVPEAIQSTPHEGEKRTQWLLSWSMPLSSLAAGLVALVRLRVRRPEVVLVSATGNPLAEIGLLRIASGSTLVLRPRALRGIIQPTGRAVRITRHWRLAHLSAWLTLQFRYLVFHGPCDLIVQGTRGVRLERAGPGRGINQAATLGFSAGLAYSVRRSEAFGAYLIGKQELFNDSFESADGWYLYEEMPREGEKGGLWGRGIKGLGDAALKVFGL